MDFMVHVSPQSVLILQTPKGKSMKRRLSLVDKLIVNADQALRTLVPSAATAARENPGKQHPNAIDYDHNDAVRALVSILSDDKQLLECRKNALEFAGEFEWSAIFENAFRESNIYI